MHKFEKRDAKSRTLVILAVVGLAAAITVGIFTAVRMIRKPAASKNDPKTGIVYDESAIEGGWDNLSPEEIAEKLNEKVAEGMINISMNTAPYFENGASEGNIMIVNESINNYPQQVEFIRNDTAEARSHMEWHIASMFGELMPDCGIYFLREGRSYMTEDEHKKILCNMKDYAICVVKLIWEKPNHED